MLTSPRLWRPIFGAGFAGSANERLRVARKTVNQKQGVFELGIILLFRRGGLMRLARVTMRLMRYAQGEAI
jgi:hypothetical protein